MNDHTISKLELLSENEDTQQDLKWNLPEAAKSRDQAQ